MTWDHEAASRRLERLSRLRDHDVSRDEPDPRGWPVINRDGRAVGEVTDLIVDTDRMRAEYLDIELDAKLFDLGRSDRHVLVPLERAHRAGKRLLIEDISRAWVDELRAARDEHQREFWDRWWHRRVADHPVPLEDAVGRPVADEPLREDVVVNRADEEPPWRQR
jgi:sporulation protein YlmC with PRC-barrel domain